MSTVQKVALDAAKEALSAIDRAKRNCSLALLFFGVIYLFTLTPFSDANEQLTSISTEIEAATAVVSILESKIESVREASTDTRAAVEGILDETIEKMIAQFAELHLYLRDPIRAVAAFESDGSDNLAASTSVLQMQVQRPETIDQEQLMTGELANILRAVAQAEPGHRERLRDWARANIVTASYARAQDHWAQNVRPVYLGELSATQSNARAAAEVAAEFDPISATHLNDVAEKLAKKEAELRALSLLPEETGPLPVGEEFWETTAGKFVEAERIRNDVETRLAAVQILTDSLDDPLAAATELQLALQAELRARVAELEAQFAEQKKRLSGVVGFVDALPLDLAAFVYFFPLVLVGVVGFFVYRTATARTDLTASLVFFDADDLEFNRLRDWHRQRALGGSARIARLRLLGLGVFTLAWVVVSTYQIGRGVEPWLLPRNLLLALTVLLLVATFGQGLIAIRRLSRASDAGP